MNTVIDMMIHVNDPAVKPLMEASLARIPGVIEARLKTPKPHLLFVSYDPERFNIGSVPEIARGLGSQAQVVEL
ncbi:MAG: hypothetical protein ACYCYL_11935 [Acidithiobacillus sp.]|uniref:hypothetical protein n=1 Tax=Acidithiobacillus ferrooxidans TaxID=920 RepID=UPI000A706049|nr:hypothetical protein [Acidithiobacillus ferrooxidans]